MGVGDVVCMVEWGGEEWWGMVVWEGRKEVVGGGGGWFVCDWRLLMV